MVDNAGGSRSSSSVSDVSPDYGILEATQARQAFSNAEHSFKLAVEEKTKAEKDLNDLFSADGFGIEGEWKKLENTCLELDTGECVFESSFRKCE